MDLFSRSWKGQASLAAAFWLVYFIGGLILSLIVAFIFARMRPDLLTSEVYSHIIVAILFPYTLFSAICVWRCAVNSNIVWRILARIVVTFAVIGGIVSIISLLWNG